MITLSSNQLKIIAAVTMLIDHMGLMLFPGHIILRIIGRISFPIFAFMISEGCFYTKNKSRYFLRFFSLALLCQGGYFIFNQSLDMGVLVTFSVAILLIYALDKSVLLFVLLIPVVYFLNIYVDIDYGFWGCMVPVFPSLLKNTKYDSLVDRIFMLTVALAILSFVLGGVQLYCLLAVPFLLLYSGKRGKVNMKWFFYIFYPLHLVVLYIIANGGIL